MKVQITYDDTLYQLVPKEATTRIKRAIFVMLASADDEDRFYRKVIEMASLEATSLLSAAPTPPAQPKLPPGFHNCTASNEPVQTGVLISCEPEQSLRVEISNEEFKRLTETPPGAVVFHPAPAQPAERMPLTEDDVFTLTGQAVVMKNDGKTDMPAYFLGLAERIAETIGDEALAKRTRELCAAHGITAPKPQDKS